MKKMLLFLFFLSFILNSISQNKAKNDVIKVKIENQLNIWRKGEVIDLEWDSLVKKNPQFLLEKFIVTNNLSGEQYPYQIIKNEDDKPVKLIFEASIGPKTVLNLSIKKGIPATYKTKTFGRFAPERMDDFAWENDKIAFRMYGPALQATGEISNGIDVWVKRTSEMIIDKWYKIDDYHQDHGEGLDCYKVGPTLGAGGIAPVANGKLYYSRNWSTYKVLTSGNLRTVFELTYNPWNFNGIEISETKRITLNAGSQLNMVEVVYDAKGLDTIPVATGIIKRPESGVMVMNEQAGFISYWEPSNPQNGTTGVGLVIPQNLGMSVIENHLVAFSKAVNHQTFKYYQGACWDKAGEIKNDEAWTNYLKEFALKRGNALVISY